MRKAHPDVDFCPGLDYQFFDSPIQAVYEQDPHHLIYGLIHNRDRIRASIEDIKQDIKELKVRMGCMKAGIEDFQFDEVEEVERELQIQTEKKTVFNREFRSLERQLAPHAKVVADFYDRMEKAKIEVATLPAVPAPLPTQVPALDPIRVPSPEIALNKSGYLSE